MKSRRNFIKQTSILLGMGIFVNSIACKTKNKYARIKGQLLAGNNKRGHLLREMHFETPNECIEMDVVIIGSGISALTAARKLKNNRIENFIVLELDEQIGGNAISGKNEICAYPWAAHYLPIPNASDNELLDFLKEINVITHFNDKGIPCYNEEYLCAEPEERLFINGYWQNGLIPNTGIPKFEKEIIERFLKKMSEFKKAIGSDGKPAFTIPNALSSKDKTFTDLDNISFIDYLKNNHFSCDSLLWYLNYCCSDDYGTNIKDCSAWAGIHYFAARKGMAANAEYDTVLTWPEGNAFLANKLAQSLSNHIKKNKMVFEINSNEDESVNVNYYCFDTNTSKQIKAKKVIVCTPQFVNKKIVKEYHSLIKDAAFTYSPWMVANLSIENFDDGSEGQPMSWDNVIYGGKSLGYVNASHQLLQGNQSKKVITFYLPLNTLSPKIERENAYHKSYSDWLDIIFEELKIVHPNLINHVAHVDIKLWGHSMVRPTVGLREQLNHPIFSNGINNKIFFAHSDLSGISIFEEAFYQGNKAANQVIKSLKNA